MLTLGALSCKNPARSRLARTLRQPSLIMPAATSSLLRIIVSAALLVTAQCASAAEPTTSAPSSSAPTVDYLREVKPLLAAKCYTCHGALKQEAGLRLDTRAAMIRGGDTGPAIVAGNPAESLLLARLAAPVEERMPPEGEGEAFKPAELTLLTTWIAAGAPAPVEEKPEADPRDHWAFRAPQAPPIPKVADPAWSQNPIDAFIAAEHERRGLKPVAEADPQLLLRRLHFDLIGLPPTEAELQAFASPLSLSPSLPVSRSGGEDKETGRQGDLEQQYARTVDALLASPQYGERWGRHWMDVWRYSDWWGLGAEVRNSQKHIWHWRDWIIESLNDDVGYDEMVRQMIAADELYPTDAERLRAGGFLARNYFKFNRTTWLDGVIEHTGKAFLGLTVNCSKCHDHKYDPIAQTDYYRLRAVFEPYQLRTDQVPGQIDFERDGIPRPFDCNLNEPTFVHFRGNDTQPLKDKPLEPGVPPVLEFAKFEVAAIDLPLEAYQPALQPFVLDDYLRDAETQIAAARDALAKAREAKTPGAVNIAEKRLAAAMRSPDALRARAAATRASVLEPKSPETTKLAEAAARAERELALARGDADLAAAEEALAVADEKQRPDAEKKLTAAKAAVDTARKALEKPGTTFTPLRGALKTLESNLENEASRGKPFPAASTGRRTALARWLTDVRNPLTARVAVNHIWARHFGTPLVPTVFDFGRKGKPPTHPELLDWLAVDFMHHGWNMKRLHRMIVTSRTYRLSASPVGVDSATLAADRENKFYWRRNSVRLEAQAVRDALLQLSGTLDPTLGGPSIPVADEASRRRSLYYVHSHNEHQKFLALFDDAGVQECYRRSESIVPQQALALSNSKLALTAASAIAARLEAESSSTQRETASDDEAFVDRAWRTVLCVEPSADEQAACVDAMRQWRESAAARKLPDGERQAKAKLVEALINHNDFVTVR